MESTAIAIAGPTASGKSALALRLAETLPGGATIINADSRQVYAELRILTARPAPAEEARVPHRLYGHRAAAEPYSVGRWREEALAAIRDSESAGRVPIVVGGTGLYFHALTAGIAAVPAIPPAVRARVRARLRRRGSAALHAALGVRDPETAAALEPGDGQRVARALEVLEATGRPLAAWRRDADHGARLAPAARIVLQPERAALYRRIDSRFAAMVEAGALAEAARLAELGLESAAPAMSAHGVPELMAHLAGGTTLEAAVADAQAATRRFAKRQMTWFRNRMRDWTPLAVPAPGDAQQMESIAAQIFPLIR